MNNEPNSKNVVNLDGEALETVAGGAYMQDQYFNLGNYAYRTVNVPAGTLLVMQDSPGGAFLGTSFSNGEQILVNKFVSEYGYLLAFKDGTFGYVDQRYVR
ncbi:MAG: hypothetical protein K6C12_07615 [Oscillospiraceae bacterium]|nr:hypothetical protein [Oscillospiraceae bacterium]